MTWDKLREKLEFPFLLWFMNVCTKINFEVGFFAQPFVTHFRHSISYFIYDVRQMRMLRPEKKTQRDMNQSIVIRMHHQSLVEDFK